MKSEAEMQTEGRQILRLREQARNNRIIDQAIQESQKTLDYLNEAADQ